MNKVLLSLVLALSMGGVAAQPVQFAPPPGDAVAARDLELRKQMEERVHRYAVDEAALQRSVQAAQERTVFCSYCHGEDGNSTRDHIPSLAGQSPVYLLDQFERFGDGRRKDFVMAELARTFSDEEKVNLSIYYSRMNMRPAGGDPAKVAAGKQVFETFCVQCHGADAKGEEGYARLAGQRPTYVVKMLKEFRDQTGRRANPWMTAVTVRLSEADMEAVAAYLAGLE